MKSLQPIPLANRHSTGFTLIEAIMVIVITGILASAVAVFIVNPVQGYIDSVRRAELTDQADLVMRRVVRETHLALPNSVRVGDSSGNSGSCAALPSVTCFIEFIPTSVGGRYRALGDGSTGGNILSFTSAANVTFDVLGSMPTNPAIAPNDYVVVYNQGPGYSPADAYIGRNRAQIAAAGISGNTITLTANPFATYSTPASPNNGFHVVPGDVQAVTLACPTVTSGNLTRYWNYGFNASLATTPSGTSALLATNATCSNVNWDRTNALLTVTLTLTNPDSKESVVLYREIRVDNVP